MRFGFIGGSYTSQSITAECQRCVNLYPESIESQAGASAMALYCTPGLKLFVDLHGDQVRGQFTINGRDFAVVDATLYEILANGTGNALGNVGNDGTQVSFAVCPQQLLIESVGNLYAYQLVTQTIANGNTIVAGTFQKVPNLPWSPAALTQIDYIDGFFLALVAGSQTIYASNLFDGTTWSALSIKTINKFADNVVGMKVNNDYLWIFGAKQSEVDYDAGSFPFPLAAIPSGFIEQGCGAQDSIVSLDNAIFLIGQRNDQGQAIAWRTNGFSFQRVSTHAIETAWQSYPRISDAVAFSYQDQGHSFWVITFPSAQVTWCYDVATGLWHERGVWNQELGIFQAALPIGHSFCFGKHLVGDRTSGKVYQASIPVQQGQGWGFCDDGGIPIRRLRRAPHINSEHSWMRYSALEIYLETGLGPQPPLLDGGGNPRGPEVILRQSRDGGHTWSAPWSKDCGQAGDYRKRVVYRRLGRARDMVFELSMADPVPWRITDAFLNPQQQPGPRKRLVSQFAEVA